MGEEKGIGICKARTACPCVAILFARARDVTQAGRLLFSLSLTNTQMAERQRPQLVGLENGLFASTKAISSSLSAEDPSFCPRALSTTCFGLSSHHRTEVPLLEENYRLGQLPAASKTSSESQQRSRQKLISLLIDNSLGKV